MLFRSRKAQTLIATDADDIKKAASLNPGKFTVTKSQSTASFITSMRQLNATGIPPPHHNDGKIAALRMPRKARMPKTHDGHSAADLPRSHVDCERPVISAQAL